MLSIPIPAAASPALHRVYISNLPSGVDAAGVSTLFSRFGGVEHVHVVPPDGDRTASGRGYVDMDPESCRNACEALDGFDFNGSVIAVREASVRPPPAAARGNKDDGVAANLPRRRFEVVAIEQAPAPAGASGDDWYRYELLCGKARITGLRQGSLAEVREYAADCASEFNERSATGKIGRTMPFSRKR